MKRVYYEGSKFKNKRGTWITLVQKTEGCFWLAKVDNTEYSFMVNNTHLKRGEFKTPVCKTVYGTGYMGVGEHFCRDSDGVVSRAYSVWANMIKRCYMQYEGKSKGLYDDVNVIEEWHNFQNFAGWYTDKIKAFDEYNILPKLDKDLLRGREYSPSSCIMLPNIINCSLGEVRSSSKFKHGVYKDRDGVSYRALIMFKNKSINLGKFKTKESALNAYLHRKKENLKELAEEYRHVLEYRAYKVLINWEPSEGTYE